MNNIKTVIYAPTGYYGSTKLWNDPSFAFRNRNEHPYTAYGTFAKKPPKDDWQYLGNDRSRIAQTLGVDVDILPEWDYECAVLEDK
jgi:hypothetical protein